MYLSKLILNPRSRQVQHEIIDPYEMHRTIMRAFAENHPENERVLFRLEMHPVTGMPILLVQSYNPPDWKFLFPSAKNYLVSPDQMAFDESNPAVKQVEVRLKIGQKLAFRLRANPTVKKDRPGKKQGRRVGLYQEEDQLNWLKRKFDEAGGYVISAHTSNMEQINGKRHHDEQVSDLSFLVVQFDGILQVREPAKMEQTLISGMGSGKGLGFGLLSLAPARY
jgi:CRISPR system Cascade subunit CasE